MKKAYLTIDDGPSKDTVKKVDFLSGKGISAIFFCRGDFLEENKNAAIHAINKNQISEESWLYFPEPNLIFNRGYEPKNFDSSLAPKEQSAICLEVTYLNGDEIDQKSDNEIIERVKVDFLKTNLVKMEDISSAHLIRVKNIYPLYDLDYFDKLNSILSYLSQFESLYTAGRQGLFNYLTNPLKILCKI